MILFDSHCHLTSDAFDGDLDGVLARAHRAGVTSCTCIASTPDDAAAALALARSREGIWCTAGIHPHEAGGAAPGDLDRVRTFLAEPEVVAVGECGLDFYYDNAPRDEQFAVFRGQVSLALDSGLPLVVHSRDADEEMRRELRSDAGRARGVLHCFTGGDELLEAALEADWYVSFSGIVTFGRFDGADRVRRVPSDRILVETDSPYLAPVPRRGKRNEPAFVADTLRRVAEIRGVSPEEMARVTTANARRFYRLDRDGPGGTPGASGAPEGSSR